MGSGGFDFTGEGDIPVLSFLENGGLLNGSLEVAGFAELDPADFGEVDLGSFDFNALGKAEAFPLAFLFKSGKAGGLSLFDSSEEVGKGSVEIFEGLLKDLAVDVT